MYARTHTHAHTHIYIYIYIYIIEREKERERERLLGTPYGQNNHYVATCTKRNGQFCGWPSETFIAETGSLVLA